MINKKRYKNNLNLMLVYIYGFYVIYAPRFTDLYFGIRTEIFLGLLLVTLGFISFVIHNGKIPINKKIIDLSIFLMISIVYLTIMSLVYKTENRVLQNSFIFVQIGHIILLNFFLNKIGYDSYNKMYFLIKLAFLQGIISIFMLMIPEFKELANNLYFLNREENLFISSSRIYGISGDYTFFTPIYNTIIALIATVDYLIKSKKTIYFIPFILLTVSLNSRFGIFMYILIVMVLISYYFFKLYRIKRLIKNLIFIPILATFVILVIYFYSNETFAFFLSGINVVEELIFNRQLERHLYYLFDSMLFFPRIENIFFGLGHRVFGKTGLFYGYPSSDIGYVNDIFLGGIVYFILIIFVLARYLSNIIGNNMIDSSYRMSIFIVLVMSFILANYKGEIFRGGSVITGIYLITLFFIDNLNNFKKVNT